MDLGNKQLYLIGLISCLLCLGAPVDCHRLVNVTRVRCATGAPIYISSEPVGCHSVVKRNAWQMCNMVHQYTHRACTGYSPYGCFCGFGQQGSNPTDSADSCCKTHDDCYGDVTASNSCSFWSIFVGYDYSCGDDGCQCNDDTASAGCSRQVCECDLALAVCLGNSDYNPAFYGYDRTQCV